MRQGAEKANRGESELFGKDFPGAGVNGKGEMRVGLFTESYEPVINGVSTSVRTLAEELAAAGEEPVIVAPRFAGYADEGPFPVLRIPSWRGVIWVPWWEAGKTPPLRWKTKGNPDNPFAYPPLPLTPPPAVLRDVSFDIVHTQHPFGMGLQARRVARRLRVPLIATFHTLYTEYAHYLPLPRFLTVAGIAASLRAFYQTCDAIIVPSHEAGRRLEGLGVDSSRLRVIPTGIPAAREVSPEEIAAARHRFDLPDDAPVVLYVGRLAREKNLDLLLDAFADLSDTPAYLLLVGSGPYAEEAKARASHVSEKDTGRAGRVRFAGFIPHDELPPIYAAASIFAFPSGSETQGLAIAEAQSYGLPCVVVGAGGAPESVRDGVDALIVPPELAAFRAALRDLLTNDTRRRTLSAAARASPLRLTPAGMAQSILAVYETALHR